MAKRRSPARALFQLQEPCCCCLDASRRTVRCACSFSYCESCLHEVIHQWVVDQDETNPDSPLISPADLDDASEALPPPIINNLRYRNLSDRKSTRLNSSHSSISYPVFFFFNDTATTEIYTLSLHDALPILISPADLDDASEALPPPIINNLRYRNL